jgi:hypothetical protein
VVTAHIRPALLYREIFQNGWNFLHLSTPLLGSGKARQAGHACLAFNATTGGKNVDSFQHPEAHTIRPRWAGEPFDLHACVQALFTIRLPKPTTNLDQQAA